MEKQNTNSQDPSDQEKNTQIPKEIEEILEAENEDDMYEDIDDEDEGSYRFFEAERLLEGIYRDYIQDRIDLIYRIEFSDNLGLVIDNVLGEANNSTGFPVLEARTDNMHDTNITIKMKEACEKLADAGEADEESLLQLVVKQKMDRKTKLRAIQAIALVLDLDTVCESYNMSEGKLLKKMAQPILQCIESEQCPHDGACQSKIDNLMMALSDMFDENGDPICVMGRMTRIYDALCSGDYLVPKNFLEQEIASKCAVLTRELGEENATQQALLEKLEENYQGILTKEQLSEIIAPWF